MAIGYENMNFAPVFPGSAFGMGSFISGSGAAFRPLSSPFPSGNADLDSLVERLADRMLNVPVILVCSFCEAANAVSNPTCVGCNAPLGKAQKRKL